MVWLWWSAAVKETLTGGTCWLLVVDKDYLWNIFRISYSYDHLTPVHDPLLNWVLPLIHCSGSILLSFYQIGRRIQLGKGTVGVNRQGTLLHTNISIGKLHKQNGWSRREWNGQLKSPAKVRQELPSIGPETIEMRQGLGRIHKLKCPLFELLH